MDSQHDVLATMSAHRTVRSFTSDRVPETDIEAAVRAAQMAATSSWIQAYSLLQVREPEVRSKLAELCGGQPQVEQAGAFFVVQADVRRHLLVAEDAGVPYPMTLENFLLATVDASLFAQNLALAFESQGYGICYIGGLRNRLPEADALLELPEGVWPLFGLCVGKAAEDPGQRPRMPLGAVWMRDRYATDPELREGIAEHDREAANYYNSRGAAGRNWSGGLWRKFQRPQREHLADFYRSKGARLQ